MSEIAIETLADLDAMRDKAEREKDDDLFGAVEAVDYAFQQGVFVLPVSIARPNPPDAVISSQGKPVLAVEVTRVTWQRLSEVEAAAGPGELIELNPELCVDRKARRDRKAPKGARTGSFRAIKAFGEKLDGLGWVGDEMEAKTLDALEAAITDKQTRFQSYAASAGRVWLFLIDDGLVGAWEGILSNPDFKARAEAICAASSFERVLLFRFGPRSVTVLL